MEGNPIRYLKFKNIKQYLHNNYRLFNLQQTGFSYKMCDNKNAYKRLAGFSFIKLIQ